ncbi:MULTISPECIES: SGNH/GDSL hydrolase family protein [unclassified Gordonia (in: high G+C Gram-positive bacteria)]
MSLLAYARRAGVLVVSAWFAAAIAGAGSASATPAPASVAYVNIGDSYSSGAGVMPTAPGTSPLCAQSEANYAHLIARQFGYHLTDVSCGGAKTDDFFAAQYPGLRPQLDAVTPDADLVTFMIGGNDGMVFAETVAKCVAAAATTGGQGSPCANTYGDSIIAQITTDTYPKLVRAMAAVRARAPGARVAVIGYPWIMPARYQPCPAFPVATGDVAYTHGIHAALNDSIQRAAQQTGVTYIDAATPSIGHDSCQPVGGRWVEPLVSDQQIVPVHPNALGERELATITVDALDLTR